MGVEGQMPQAEDHIETLEEPSQLVGELEVAEFAVLLPTQALFVSALSAGEPERHGYSVDDGLHIMLPERVWRTLGFCPSPEAPVKNSTDTYRLLFDPASDNLAGTVWDVLFSETKPQIVMEFIVDHDAGRPVVSISDSWLEWPWWIASDERLEHLTSAQQAYDELADSVDWPKLAEQSATVGPKSALFDAVAKHVAAQAGVADTL